MRTSSLRFLGVAVAVAAVVAGGMVVGTAFTWVLMPSLLRLGEDREAVPVDATPSAPQGESVT
jgi:hypothetical protein